MVGKLDSPFITYNLKPSTTHVLATTAIGGKYFEDWSERSAPGWLQYAKKFNLGIVVAADELLSPSDQYYKGPSWQKLLLPHLIEDSLPNVKRVALIDTDILISPLAPNIFDVSPPEKIGVVSLYKNLPMDYYDVRSRIAFFRQAYYDPEYPLESELLASPEVIFAHRDLTTHGDFFCAGVMVTSLKHHSDSLVSWFYDFDRDAGSALLDQHGNWEQPIVNDKVQSEGLAHWLPYEFQALWIYEMAWYYPFLYRSNPALSDSAADCIVSTLSRNYFLHFAGSWPESDMWRCATTIPTVELDELADLGLVSTRIHATPSLGKLQPTARIQSH